MNPETAADRQHMLADFGELVQITPAGGGERFRVWALFDDGPRESEDLDLNAYTDSSVTGSEPRLKITKEDAAKIELGSAVVIPSELPKTYRITTEEPDDVDKGYRLFAVMEA